MSFLCLDVAPETTRIELFGQEAAAAINPMSSSLALPRSGAALSLAFSTPSSKPSILEWGLLGMTFAITVAWPFA